MNKYSIYILHKMKLGIIMIVLFFVFSCNYSTWILCQLRLVIIMVVLLFELLCNYIFTGLCIIKCCPEIICFSHVNQSKYMHLSCVRTQKECIVLKLSTSVDMYLQNANKYSVLNFGWCDLNTCIKHTKIKVLQIKFNIVTFQHKHCAV